MRIPEHLVGRLARLEARVESLRDPEAEREGKRLHLLYHYTWLDGGSLEDIPEEDRDPQLWKLHTTSFLEAFELYWEGSVPVPQELLEAGIDFKRAEGVDEDSVRAFLKRVIYEPDTPDEP